MNPPGGYQIVNLLCMLLLFMAGTIQACAPKLDEEKIAAMNVKVISLDKCGATLPTISRLERVASEMGIKITLEHIVVKTREEAIAQRHIGSPTVQVNGIDIDPGAREINQFGVT